jgi:hypothetical protein
MNCGATFIFLLGKYSDFSLEKTKISVKIFLGKKETLNNDFHDTLPASSLQG